MQNFSLHTEVVNDAKHLFVMVLLVQLNSFIVMTMLSLVYFSKKSDRKLPDGFTDGECECSQNMERCNDGTVDIRGEDRYVFMCSMSIPAM